MAATPALLRILACAHSASIKAGKVVRDVMEKGDLGIKEKTGKDDLQTLADTTAQQCIIGTVRHSFPLATIIGEEGQMGKDDVAPQWKEAVDPHADILAAQCPKEYVDLKEDQFTIWVDPLDGTKEYTEGLVDHVTVLIGLAVGERPIAGIIHQPFFLNNEGTKGRTIWGIKGVGAGGPITITPPDSTRFIITTSRSHLTPEIERAVKSLNPDEIIRVGGAGYKVLLLLEGKAHAYVFPSAGCKRWDTCAPEAVLSAIGGILSGMDGDLYSYHRDCNPLNERGVLAARLPQFHDRVIQALKAAKGTIS